MRNVRNEYAHVTVQSDTVFILQFISSREHAYIILTPLNPTFI